MEKCKELIDELVERLEELDVPQHVLEMAKGLQGEISELYSGSEEDEEGSEEDDKDLEEHSPEEIKGMPLPEMEEKMEKLGKYTRSPKTGLMVAIALHPKNKE